MITASKGWKLYRLQKSCVLAVVLSSELLCMPSTGLQPGVTAGGGAGLGARFKLRDEASGIAA